MNDTGQDDSPPAVDADTHTDDHADVDEHQDAADDQGDGQPDDGDQDGQHDDGSQREKRYRLRLRETEAERDALRTQLDTLHRDIVSDIASAAGVDPRLLATAGHDVADFIADDGRVDRAKVAEACAQAAQEFNIARRQPLQSNPQQGMRSPPPRPEASWSQLIGDAARRGRG